MSSTGPVANARMYSATPAVKRAWNDVLGWALREAELPWEVIDYDMPAPLSALWSRSDLGCAMMCGLPYSQRSPRPTLIAAPVPASGRCAGRPLYWTEFMVRAASGYGTLEETFGGVIGYTVEDSMSGFVAVRRHLRGFREPDRPQLFRKAVGGLVNARRVIEALGAEEIDVGPVNSYYHELLKKNDPAFAAKVRVVASTAAAPIPPLVATATLAEGDVKTLRAALLASGSAPGLDLQRDTLRLSGFAIPESADYDVFDGILAASQEFAGIW